MKTLAVLCKLFSALNLLAGFFLLFVAWFDARGYHEEQELVQRWKAEGPHATMLGGMRERLVNAPWLRPLRLTPLRDPLAECGPQALPVVGGRQRLACLKREMDMAREEHRAFTSGFLVASACCCLVLFTMCGTLLLVRRWTRRPPQEEEAGPLSEEAMEPRKSVPATDEAENALYEPRGKQYGDEENPQGKMVLDEATEEKPHGTKKEKDREEKAAENMSMSRNAEEDAKNEEVQSCSPAMARQEVADAQGTAKTAPHSTQDADPAVSCCDQAQQEIQEARRTCSSRTGQWEGAEDGRRQVKRRVSSCLDAGFLEEWVASHSGQVIHGPIEASVVEMLHGFRAMLAGPNRE